MFRRPRFIPVRRTILPEIPRALRRAHQLMETGRYIEAAKAFEQLAQGAQVRGLPHDVNLFFSAGQCWLLANQIDPAMCNFKQGLGFLSARGKEFRIYKAGQRCIRQLKEAGYVQEAEEILQLIQSTLPPGITEQGEEKAVKRQPLPVNCPACGGTLRSDEVEWIDDSSAECAWCGTVVKTIEA